MSHQNPLSTLPTVSVVLPVRNEAAYIGRSLGAVLAQDYPADRMEIIVADGASTDGTVEIVRRAMADVPTLRLVENPAQIVATGLNRAIAQSHGQIVVRVDGHCEIAADYVRRCVGHLEQGVDGVGGPVETIGETPLAEAIAAAMSSRFGVGDSSFRTTTDQTMLADTVPFAAYTRAIIDRAGPYDEELVRNQDDEYNYRLRKMGARVLLAADVRSRYYSRSSMKTLWRQYRQYGFWKVRVLQKHPRQMSARQFVPPLFVGSIALSAAAAPWSGAAALGLAGIAGAYAVANLAATAAVARSRSLRRPSVLPLVFATLHIGYGVGFLHGLLHFRDRWRSSATSPSSSTSPHRDALAPPTEEPAIPAALRDRC